MEELSETDLQQLRSWLGSGSINIFGLPFAGKDTHGHQLAGVFGAAIMGGGEILRNSVIPERITVIMESGALIPTEDYINIVLPYLSKAEFTNKPLILSSVGRWHGEEPGVIGAASESGHPIKAVIYLHVTEATAHERHVASREDEKRGDRNDDAEHVLATRFAEFHDKTLPVIDYYRGLGILIEVDGNPPVNEVRTTILRKLITLAKSQNAAA